MGGAVHGSGWVERWRALRHSPVAQQRLHRQVSRQSKVTQLQSTASGAAGAHLHPVLRHGVVVPVLVVERVAHLRAEKVAT